MIKNALRKIASPLIENRVVFTRNGVFLRSYTLGRCLKKLAVTYPRLFSKDIALDKLLMGGEGTYSAASYARITSDLRRPSCPITQSPHADLLRAYRTSGGDIFTPERFEATSYYKNAMKCMELFGNYFAATKPEDIVKRAKKFCEMLDNKFFKKHELEENEPGSLVVVRRIGFSDCYEIIHGHHRLAVASVKGLPTYLCQIDLSEPALTPIQQIIMDSSWTHGRPELYQPISTPELATWPVVRRCADRFRMMMKWLAEKGIRPGSYLDIGSSYGWFVAEMAKQGFETSGVDRDIAAVSIGRMAYGLDQSSHITVGDIIGFLDQEKRRYDITSCFSVLHHFVMRNGRCTAPEFIQKLDAVTGTALFFDMGECHESWFSKSLAGWDAPFIQKWLKENTSFTRIEILGIDSDNVGPYRDQYRRHLFVCSRD